MARGRDERAGLWLQRTGRTSAEWAEEKLVWLQRVVRAGQNLSLATEIVGHFYFPEETDAREAADWLSELEYEVRIEPVGESRWPWHVSSRLDTYPSEANFELLDGRFTNVAERLSGSYFGLRISVPA